MRILPFLLVILLCYPATYEAQERELAIADSLLLLTIADSSLTILRSLDSTDQPGIAFRVQLLEAIIAGTSNEETVSNIEDIVEKYRDADFPTLAKVTYMNYFSEIMIPDQSWDEYNQNFLSEILDIYYEGGEQDSFILMHMLHNKGNLLYNLKRHHEAISVLESSVEIARKIDTRDSSLLGIIIFNLANPYYSIGKFQKSYELVEETEKYLSSLKNPNRDYFQTVYLDLFSSSLEFGYLEKAENYLNKAANLLQEMRLDTLNNSKERIDRKDLSLLYNYMRLYVQQENIPAAEGILKNADEKYRDYEEYFYRLRLAAINNYMGECYVIKDPEKSFRHYLNAVRVLDQPDDLTFNIMFEFNLGKAYLNSKRYKKASAVAESVLSKAVPVNDNRLPYFHFLDADILIQQELFSKSLKHLNLVANSVNQGSTPIDLLSQEGILEFTNKENSDLGYLMSGAAQSIDKHIPPSRESNTVMNSLYRLAISNFQQSFTQNVFSEKSQREYEIMLSGLLRTDAYLNNKSVPYEELLRFSENSTSRSLWEQFKLKNEGLDLIDPAIIAQEQSLRTQITTLKTGTPEDSIKLKEELFELELALEKLDLEKRKKNTSFYKYEDFSFDFKNFQNQLADDDLILKYEYLDSILYVYEITKDQLDIRPLDSLTIIDRRVSLFTNLLRDPSSDGGKITSLATEIADILLPSTLKENILIVSDGILNYLPFDLLRREEKYLLESHVISNTTSLSLLDIASTSNDIRSSIIVAPSYDKYTLSTQQLAVRGDAYNLEGALSEAEAISKIIPSRKWSKADALKARFMKEATEYDLLHLSMHSFMNDEDPELSSLVFHDGESDNELYISELYGLNLKAKLAVLSACNTGVGKEKTGEGMVSVNRAFTYAGVPAVVSSLWSAPDQATKEIMTHFYTGLKDGDSKAVALRNAKRTYLANQKVEGLKHPFFWAGFVLHGDPVALEFKGTSLSTKIWIFLGVAVAFFFLFANIRKLNAKRAS